MKTHTVEVEGLIKWAQQEEVEFASSTRERKSLVATLFGGYKVIVAGSVIWEGVHPSAAVEAYNAITEKIEDTFPKHFRI